MTFSGLPVIGEIVHGEPAKPQRPDEDFTALLQAVLDDPTIAFVEWEQYTPYFNDGDPCVFHSYGLRACPLTEAGTPWESTNGDRWDLEFPPYGDELAAILGRRENYGRGAYSGPDEARYDRLEALAKAIDSQEFATLLLKSFGDHARVKVVPRDGIYVDYCEHD